jgi:hypothetical protein
MNRRRFLAAAAALAASSGAGFLPVRAEPAGDAPRRLVERHGGLPLVRVSKSPLCGCCDAWVDHIRVAGFPVEIHDLPQAALDALKARLGIGPALASCHTAEVAGYVVEGHVPAPDVLRLLDEGPDAAGLAVPGMPIGSPGMETGDTREPFETLLLGADGAVTVFARHG